MSQVALPGLHCACTHDINRNVRKCAKELEDFFLLAKLAAGDMIAIEAKYHSKCLATLYNKARSAKQVCNESDDSHLHGIEFAELVAFMEDFRMEQNISPVFKLADLAKLYQTRLEDLGGKAGEHLHHEQRQGVQETFLKEVKSLVPVIENMGNPFLENSEDLIVLDTRDFVDASVRETVRNAETLGKEQYEVFVDERLIQGKIPTTEVISKNKLALFSRPPVKRPSMQKMKIASLKSDCVFTHENQAAPPSLSVGGGLRLGTKADLLQCLALEEKQSVNAPVVTL